MPKPKMMTKKQIALNEKLSNASQDLGRLFFRCLDDAIDNSDIFTGFNDEEVSVVCIGALARVSASFMACLQPKKSSNVTIDDIVDKFAERIKFIVNMSNEDVPRGTMEKSDDK